MNLNPSFLREDGNMIHLLVRPLPKGREPRETGWVGAPNCGSEPS